jgi:hypothetical protein
MKSSRERVARLVRTRSRVLSQEGEAFCLEKLATATPPRFYANMSNQLAQFIHLREGSRSTQAAIPMSIFGRPANAAGRR